MLEAPKAIGPVAVAVAVALALAVVTSVKAAVAEEECNRNSITVCGCDLTKLRPLQGAVGEKEVENKREEILRDPKKAIKRLRKDPIKVVFGYGRDLYIVDHHHAAKAWLEANTKTMKKRSLCQIVNGDNKLPYDYPSLAQFWTALEGKELIHLKDQKGDTIKEDALPKTIDALPDDVYRSFAWKVRLNKGFCKSSQAKDFLEFIWADAAFRNNFKNLTNDNLDQSVKAGVDEAHKEQYNKLPGWTSSGDCKTST
jgi:hypothetical protein